MPTAQLVVPDLHQERHHRRVIIESPFAGDVEKNQAYARAALRDCLLRGEAPLASHLLYTQPGVLDDDNPAERVHGIDAGLAWGCLAEATIVYDDLGLSRGMVYGIERAQREGRPVEYRQLMGWSKSPPTATEIQAFVVESLDTVLVPKLGEAIVGAIESQRSM